MASADTLLPSVIDVVIRDGSTVCLREAHAADIPALVAFLEGLSPASRYFRFLGYPHVTAARILPLVDPAGGAAALVAEAAGRILGFAGFHREGAGDCAEVAFAVADAAQGHGIGTRLLEEL